MNIKKKIASVVLTIFLLATFVSPAYAMSPSDMPEAKFESIWNTVQDMIKIQKPAASQEKSTANPAPTVENPVSKDVGQPEEVKQPEAPKPIPSPTEPPAPAKPAPAPAAPAPEKSAPAPSKSAPGFEYTAFEQKVLELVNIEREKAGLKPLKLDPSLTKAARAKAEDMVENNYFSHTSPTWGTFGEQLKHFGIKYSNAGENIAAGQKTPEAVVRAWMNSPGHRANILSAKFNKMGLGYAYKPAGNYRHYWAQWFTN